MAYMYNYMCYNLRELDSNAPYCDKVSFRNLKSHLQSNILKGNSCQKLAMFANYLFNGGITRTTATAAATLNHTGTLFRLHSISSFSYKPTISKALE